MYNLVAVADLKCQALLNYTANVSGFNRKIGDLVGDFTKKKL